MLRSYMLLFRDGILMSYAQILFSNSRPLGMFLMVLTFLHPNMALSGLIAIISVIITAKLLNISTLQIQDGSYTYNSLLLGLGIGISYELTLFTTLLLAIASTLSFFLTMFFNSLLSRLFLPFLSIPFLVSLWIVHLALPNFTSFELLKAASPPEFFNQMNDGFSQMIDILPLHNYLHLLFRSVGAIFFLYNDLAGFAILIALFFISRIYFSLAVLGFSVGYGFYRVFGGDFSTLVYSYVGFNFILTSIALGSFFLAAQTATYLLVCLIVPLIALMISGLYSLLQSVGLPLYALPFNLAVLLVLSVLPYRTHAGNLNPVWFQQFSGEKNHYSFVYQKERYKNTHYFPLTLPVLGEWYVSQGYDGKITHLGAWKFALDFDVRDETGKTFNAIGLETKDYFCYDLPVVAPADGWVVKIVDGIEDNLIGDVNLTENWGNSIIIKHAEGLYTQLSHLKKHSFKVVEGEYVYRWQVLASCGSSGRSPEPHLHFQVQTVPIVGAQTLPYPFAYYLSIKNQPSDIVFYQVPTEGERVRNLFVSPLMYEAFYFVPGKRFSWKGNKKQEEWEVFTDAYNRTYIYCHTTHSFAYFVNTGITFYFTTFEGDTQSVLFHFYNACQKVLLTYQEHAVLHEILPIEHRFPWYLAYLHDFTAPFGHYLHSTYELRFHACDNPHQPKEIILQAHNLHKVFNTLISQTTYYVQITNEGIKSLECVQKNKKRTFTCV